MTEKLCQTCAKQEKNLRRFVKLSKKNLLRRKGKFAKSHKSRTGTHTTMFNLVKRIGIA